MIQEGLGKLKRKKGSIINCDTLKGFEGLIRKSLFILFLFSISACTRSGNYPITTASPTDTPSTTPSAAPGARAAKFFFKIGTSGSFDDPSTSYSSGTTASPGSGLQAQRVFNADGSTLSTGGASSSTWPKWITSFELGLSGTDNSYAQNSKCARFTTASETSSSNCSIGGSTINCAAPEGQFRVSEFDCSIGSQATSAGNGGPSDGVYFRSQFSRDTTYLSTNENILVILEYAATSLMPAQTDPKTCFTGGNFTPELCSDFVWRAYIKHTTSEVVQPYMLLIPPTFFSVLGSTNATQGSTGTAVTTKQFIIPMAADQSLSVLQISRTNSNFPGSPASSTSSAGKLNTYCGVSAIGGTPFCAGVVLYSVTFIRI
jgi:hypothetical protein